MNEEDNKSILLQDLCERLPYYPKCEMIDELRVVNNEKDSSYTSTLFPKHIELFSYHNNFTIKPFLRPMSSMTEEEIKEYELLANHCIVTSIGFIHLEVTQLINWLNSHHFDFRGLIEKDLAIKVTEENNPYKK